MHVYVAGATGAVGTRLVAQLVERGHQVTGTTTSPAKKALLERSGARAVVVDGLDGAAVGQAVAAAAPDAIVHQMTALAGRLDVKHFDRSFAQTNRLRTEGTDHLLAAARACGVTRVVVQSYTGWPYARVGGWVKDESDPLDPDPPKEQRETLRAIRYVEDAARAVDGTVLRYGALYGGAGDQMVAMVRRRRFPIVGDGEGRWSWLHLDDAASAAVAALEGEARGVFNIVDDEPAPASEWLPYLAECLGAKAPMRVPVWIGRLAAGDVGVSMLTSTRGASNALAKRELGWQPRWASWRQGFRHGLAA